MKKKRKIYIASSKMKTISDYMIGVLFYGEFILLVICVFIYGLLLGFSMLSVFIVIASCIIVLIVLVHFALLGDD